MDQGCQDFLVCLAFQIRPVDPWGRDYPSSPVVPAPHPFLEDPSGQGVPAILVGLGARWDLCHLVVP